MRSQLLIMLSRPLLTACLVASLTMVGEVTGAHAASVPAINLLPVTWTLDGFNLSDSGSVTGSFIYDNGTNSITSWSITVTPGKPMYVGGSTFQDPYTFTPSNSSAYLGPEAPLMDAAINFSTLTPGQGGSWYSLLFYTPWPGFPVFPTAGTLPLDLSAPNYYEIRLGTNWDRRSITSGSLVASSPPVPLPPTAYLLSSGLLGLTGWRRWRKV